MELWQIVIAAIIAHFLVPILAFRVWKLVYPESFKARATDIIGDSVVVFFWELIVVFMFLRGIYLGIMKMAGVK